MILFSSPGINRADRVGMSICHKEDGRDAQSRRDVLFLPMITSF